MELKGYTNIPDWMLSLDLDVYETIILAVIYGFSQDGDSSFKGSQLYLSKKAKCSKRKVAMALPHLVQMGIISKIDHNINGVHICEYKVCTNCKGDEYGAIGGDAHGATNIIEEEIKDYSLSNKGEASKFVKPTLVEVTDYCRQRGNNVDPEAFFSFYESNGWMVGKNKMKSWKAAIITWEKREKEVAPRKREAAPARRETTFERSMRAIKQMYGEDTQFSFYPQQSKEKIDEQ